MNRRNRRGPTLIEVTVCFALACLVIANVWAIYAISQRHRVAADVRLEGVQKTTNLIERLEGDLRRIFIDSRHGLDVDDADPGRVSFYVFDRDASDLDGGVIRVRSIEYRFAKDRRVVTRTVDGGTPERLPGFFERVRFHVKALPRYHELPPAAAGLPSLVVSGGFLEYLVVALPAALAPLPDSRIRPQARTVLLGSVAMPGWRNQWKYEVWAANPTAWAVD